MAGAFTESTVIGTASDTIDRLDIPEAEKTRLKNHIPVAYAVSYLVGTGFVVWFLSAAAPRLLRIDMKAEARNWRLTSGGGGGVRTTKSAWPTRNGAFAPSAGRRRGGPDRRGSRTLREPRAGLC